MTNQEIFEMEIENEISDGMLFYELSGDASYLTTDELYELLAQ